MMAFYGGMVGAIKAGQIKRIENKLRRAGAISAKTAVMPEAAGITSEPESGLLNHLVKQGRVGRTEDGGVWWKG